MFSFTVCALFVVHISMYAEKFEMAVLHKAAEILILCMYV
jgi:hypothetical protein